MIHPDELPTWVPGDTICESKGLGWRDIAQRSYRYKGQDVLIPPINAHMIVQYQQGLTPMDREFGGRWTRTQCGPGHFSLLSRSMQSQWNWTEGLVVSHLYLTNDLMLRVARDMTNGDVGEVCLHDILQGHDPVISHIAEQLTTEAASKGPGGALYAEALGLQLAVHLLRRYASVSKRAVDQLHGLSQSEMQRLESFIDAELGSGLSLEQMAACLDLGVWALNLRLRQTIGKSPYAFVQEKRIARAVELLQGSNRPLKQVAAACGFSDQAHMTRSLRKALNITPAQMRRARA